MRLCTGRVRRVDSVLFALRNRRVRSVRRRAWARPAVSWREGGRVLQAPRARSVQWHGGSRAGHVQSGARYLMREGSAERSRVDLEGRGRGEAGGRDGEEHDPALAGSTMGRSVPDMGQECAGRFLVACYGMSVPEPGYRELLGSAPGLARRPHRVRLSSPGHGIADVSAGHRIANA
eukprot:1749403-Rhodomonas_salina.9